MKARAVNILMGLVFCLYLASIALLCFMHSEDLPNISGTWFGLPADKVAHFGMFFPFIPLAFFTFSRSRDTLRRSMILLVVIMTIGAATAYMTEIIQQKLSYRTYDAKDFFSDCLGLAGGQMIITTWLIIKHSRKRH
jgi:VanZ family protein